MASSSPILSAPVSGSPGSSSLPTQQEIQELLGTSPVPFATAAPSAAMAPPRSTGVSLPFGLQTPQQAGLLGNTTGPAAASASAAEAMSGLQEGEVNTSSPQPSEIQQLRQEMATMQGEFRHHLRALMAMLDGSSGATLHLTGMTRATSEAALNVPTLAPDVRTTRTYPNSAQELSSGPALMGPSLPAPSLHSAVPSAASALHGVEGFPHPEKFSGSEHQLVKPWLKDVYAWCDIKGISEQHRAALASYLLIQDAKIFFAERLGDRSVSQLPWTEFCDIMKAGYASPKFNMAARSQLHGLKQGEMTVQTLARKLKQLASRITTTVAEPELIYVFLRALRPALTDRCLTQPDLSEWKSLDALTGHAATQEQILKNAAGTFRAGGGHGPSGFGGGGRGPGGGPGGGLGGGSGGGSGGGRSSHGGATGKGAFKPPAGVRKPSGGAGPSKTPSPRAPGAAFGLTPAQFDERKRKGQCLYCGDRHLFEMCPRKSDAQAGRPSPAGNRPPGPLSHPKW